MGPARWTVSSSPSLAARSVAAVMGTLQSMPKRARGGRGWGAVGWELFDLRPQSAGCSTWVGARCAVHGQGRVVPRMTLAGHPPLPDAPPQATGAPRGLPRPTRPPLGQRAALTLCRRPAAAGAADSAPHAQTAPRRAAPRCAALPAGAEPRAPAAGSAALQAGGAAGCCLRVWRAVSARPGAVALTRAARAWPARR